jgi:hypothetical protein
MSTQTVIPENVLQWLTPRAVARNLRPGETIPKSLEAGFDLLGRLDPEWVWVIDYAGEIKGVLVAAYCHGAALLWRLSVLPDAGNAGAFKLLWAFRSAMRKRRIQWYMTLVDESTEMGQRLKQVVERTGGDSYGHLSLLASPLSKRELA